MFDLVAGLLLLVVWGILQFAVQPATGLIHILLGAGVIAIIRGIVRTSPGPRVTR